MIIPTYTMEVYKGDNLEKVGQLYGSPLAIEAHMRLPPGPANHWADAMIQLAGLLRDLEFEPSRVIVLHEVVTLR